jgi:hypothetical protein
VCSYYDFCRTVGSANIILASNEADNAGVPKQILENLPKMAFEKVRRANSCLESMDGSPSVCKDDSAKQKIEADQAPDSEKESVVPIERLECIANEDKEPASGLTVDPDDLSLLGGESLAACSEALSCPNHDAVTCEICQCDYEAADDVTLLPCKHYYHQHCIGQCRFNWV